MDATFDTLDLEKRLSRIECVARELSQMPKDFLGPVGATIADVEWYALGAIKKTASLSHAFCTLVRAKNTLAAAALVRLQLDTAMRIFGLTLVDDVEAAGTWLMTDQSYRKLRSRENEPLTDAFLHRKLNERYPGLTEAYEDGSAFVHLSGLHIKTSLWSRPDTPTLFFDLLGTDDSRPDEWFFELIDSFDQATNLAAELVAAFIKGRRAVRRV
ncbi:MULTISPECIES: hypothetical protein [unclassified Rhizobium]|uniref:hypothetical protein n=1 Tax=unclassified Rhizobium TaxID=2613769 RepID=UPI001ADA8430|nr:MULTISPECIES: hypothetical protein [unclassified Rhizobium]MBO9126926.1 hypothetical protein [Rhizobium sp. 16-488-2b]MBO9177374.1 hypothetical protein [Rhizobium sp. 16-488-2a]